MPKSLGFPKPTLERLDGLSAQWFVVSIPGTVPVLVSSGPTMGVNLSRPDWLVNSDCNYFLYDDRDRPFVSCAAIRLLQSVHARLCSPAQADEAVYAFTQNTAAFCSLVA